MEEATVVAVVVMAEATAVVVVVEVEVVAGVEIRWTTSVAAFAPSTGAAINLNTSKKTSTSRTNVSPLVRIVRLRTSGGLRR